MEKIDLSIIILSYNTEKLLKNCLNSIISSFKVSEFQSFKDGNCEIIIVDNFSTDNSVEMIKEFIIHNFPPSGGIPPAAVTKFNIRLIENKENLGFAKGNNVGLKEAKGEYILFLNSDTEVYNGAIKEALEFMDSNPKAGLLTPKTLFPNGKMDPDCHRGFPIPWASITYFLGLEKLFPKSKLFGQYHKFYLNLNENHEIDAGAGAFMLIPKKVIDEVGGWDEQYFFYGEDLDFCYRIKNAGYQIWFYAKPLIMHYKGASSGLRKESKNIAKNSRENRIRVAKSSVEAMDIFYKKFYKSTYPKWITFLIILAIKIKGSFRILKYTLIR